MAVTRLADGDFGAQVAVRIWLAGIEE